MPEVAILEARTVLAFVLTAVVLAAACEGDVSMSDPKPASGTPGAAGAVAMAGSPVPTPSTTDESGCAGILLEKPNDGAGFQYELEIEVAANEEIELCKFVRIGDEPLNVKWSETYFSKGSHHANVYVTGYTGDFPTVTKTGQVLDTSGVFPCPSAPQNEWVIQALVSPGFDVSNAEAARRAFGPEVLPPGVALPLASQQVLVLDYHYINPMNEPVKVCMKGNVYTNPDEPLQHEVGMMYWYNIFITVPPHATSTARMRCPVLADLNMVWASHHAHERLVGYEADLFDPAGQPTRELHRGSDWQNPNITTFPGTLALKRGESIEFACHYMNNEDRMVSQGNLSSDEMCMFAAMYWPASKMQSFCGASQSSGGELGQQFGDGDKDAIHFRDCFKKLGADAAAKAVGYLNTKDEAQLKNRFDAQSCVTSVCTEASMPLREWGNCYANHFGECQKQCAESSGSAALDCAYECLDTQHCAKELDALRAAKCNP
jgi:hypothetical protein